MERGVSSFLSSHEDASLLESGKVRCSTTGHELPATLSLLEAHWSGRTYRLKRERLEYDFTQHEPYLLPHKKASHLLWCTVTQRPVSKQPKAVAGHVAGKKFQRILAARKERAEREEADRAAAQAEGGGEEEEGEEEEEEEEEGMDGWAKEGAFWEQDGLEEGASDGDEEEREEVQLEAREGKRGDAQPRWTVPTIIETPEVNNPAARMTSTAPRLIRNTTVPQAEKVPMKGRTGKVTAKSVKAKNVKPVPAKLHAKLKKSKVVVSAAAKNRKESTGKTKLDSPSSEQSTQATRQATRK